MSTPSAQDVLDANRQVFAVQAIETFAFGLYIMIAGMSLYFLHQRKGSSRGRRVTVAFTWVMLVITIAWFYCETRLAEAELVETPATAVGMTNYCSPTNIVGNVLSTLQFFGSDALLVYRTVMVFDRHWAWTIVPCALYTAYFGIGVALNLGCLSTQLDGSLHLAPLGTLATAFYSFAAGISILLTGAISLKLFLHKRQMAKQFIGKRTSDANYVSILGILMESAAFYSGSCLIFVILDVTGNPSSVWFSGVLSAASFLCQSWIILRVALGYSYEKRSFNQTSSSNQWASRTRSVLPTPANASLPETGALESGVWEDHKGKETNAYPLVSIERNVFSTS